MPSKGNIQIISTLLIWALSLAFLIVVPKQTNFLQLGFGLVPAFVSYFFLIWNVRAMGYRHKALLIIVITGIGVRLLALFFFPQLSDDVYRFIWDGRLWHEGLSAYAYLPSTVSVDLADKAELLAEMNSPDYFTVYPPVSQLLFYLSSWSFLSVKGASIILKICFLIAELITLYFGLKLLRILKLSPSCILIYWLNPLIIVEGVGNLHLEIVMISFMLISLVSFANRDYTYAMVFLAASVGVKLLTLLLFPFLLKMTPSKFRLKNVLVMTISMLIVFSPILVGLNYAEFISSIDLYFRKFEFNASIYYLLRWVGQLFSGYNLISYIGPGLGALFLCSYYRIWIKHWKNPILSLFVVLVVYYLLATTVHPWYLSLLIICSVFLPFRLVWIWSLLIMLTYINYSYVPYREQLWIVAIEYALVFVALYFDRDKIHNKDLQLAWDKLSASLKVEDSISISET